MTRVHLMDAIVCQIVHLLLRMTGVNYHCGCGRHTTMVSTDYLLIYNRFFALHMISDNLCWCPLVNVRLLGERLEQSKEPEPNQFESQQARWPPLFSCPNCWREDRSWEEEQIFKHLHNMYWSGNPSYIKIPSEDNFTSGGRSRMIPLKWKLTIIIFAVAVLILRIYSSKKERRNSGKHKK